MRTIFEKCTVNDIVNDIVSVAITIVIGNFLARDRQTLWIWEARRCSKIPQDLDWQSIPKKDGAELEEHYRHVLEALAKEPGMLGVVFRKSQSKIRGF